MRHVILVTIIFFSNYSRLHACIGHLQIHSDSSLKSYSELKNYLTGNKPQGRKPIFVIHADEVQSHEMEKLLVALAQIHKHDFHRFDSAALNLVSENVSQFVTGKKRVIFARLNSDTNYKALERLIYMNEVNGSENNIIVASMDKNTQEIFDQKITYVTFNRRAEMMKANDILSERYEVIRFDGKKFDIGVRVFDWIEFYEIKNSLPPYYEGYPADYQVILRD
ncbi:MAG: hypothetical protein JNM93_00885 [Bacteriovoracaceae bacterium]|nr:hypothetical protein [Bacteriovoracaceae bacterium]